MSEKTWARVLVRVLAVLLVAGFSAGCGLESDQTKHNAKQKVEQKAKQAGQEVKKKVEDKGQKAGQEVKKKLEDKGQQYQKRKK